MKRCRTAAPRDQIVAGPQIQVIGVLSRISAPSASSSAVGDAFDRALRADRHERRRLDDAVRRRHAAAAREAVAVRQLKTESRGHHR